MCGICEAMHPDGGECSACGEWFRTFVDFADHGYFGGCPEGSRFIPVLEAL